MIKRLRLKFIVVNMSIVAAMLLIIFGLVYHFTKSEMDTKSMNMLQQLSKDGPVHNVESIPDRDRLPYFTIQINLHGDVSVGGYTYYDLSDEVFLQTLIQRVYTAETPSGTIEELDLRYNRVSAMGVQKLIFVDISTQRAMLSSMVQGGILIGVVSLVAFFGISVLLANWAVKPVEKAWQQQRQFVSDASHELKTPLTVIMSNAQMLKTEELDPPTREQFSGNILTMSQHMRNLVEGMLELARADNEQIRKNFTKVDYSGLLSDALLPFEPVYYEKGLILQSNIQPGISITGSEQHLHQVVQILLDNAGKYAAPGIVSVVLQRQGRGQCLLAVSNPGEPIPQQELKQIFQRFYRIDKARSRTGSFGLGLPIAQSIVSEHGGKIWAQSNPTGNCFIVQLPCQM